jgi:hypothetical protein
MEKINSNKFIYISYSQNDRRLVEKLRYDLISKRINVWFDVNEIAAGENWKDAINNGIAAANSLIFVLSKNSVNSDWMLYELNKFIGMGKKVIPILLDDVEKSKIPAGVKGLPWINFNDRYEEGFNELLKSITTDYKTKGRAKKNEIKTKGYVFLSYCEEDIEFVKPIKTFLKENNYSYWDYEESERDYHNQLFIELEFAISNASATLVILSPSWKKSKWSLREYFFSEEVNTPIFLLKAKEIPPTLAIAGIPYIDFVSNTKSGFEKLKRELTKKRL